MTLALNDQLRIPEEVLTSKVGEEMILLNLQTGIYYSLDPIGTRFLELLQRTSCLDKVHHALLQEFDVSTAKLETDLLTLFQDMLAKGLLVNGERRGHS
ncbi:MAG: PqqD family protein [Terriglobales bacterium]